MSSSKKRGSLFKLLLGATAVLLLAEWAAQGRSWSTPRYSSFLRYQHVFTPALVPGATPAGEAVRMTHDPRHPVQWIAEDKAPDSLRVVCFGGSAAAGLGHSPNVTFAKHLEILLERSFPERNVEVLNLGTVAIASGQVLELVRDALENAAPDLVVIYSGNNEYLEPHALAYAAQRGGWKHRLRRTLKRSALVRAFDRVLHGPATPADLPDRQHGANRGLTQAEIIAKIQIDPAQRRRIQARYVENLVAAARAARTDNVPVAVCTVAVNWLWSGKELREHAWQSSDDPRRVQQRVEELRNAGTSPEVIQDWRNRLELADALRALGRSEEAANAYREALEMDPHQRRATPSMGVALQAALEALDIPVLDTQAFFLQRSEEPWIGFDVFYDYVHFTPYGAALAAEGMYEFLVAQELLPGQGLENARGYATSYQAALRAQTAQTAHPDFFAWERFLGIGFDVRRMTSRDLWKYAQLGLDLNARIDEQPGDWAAHIYRGNLRAFEQGSRDLALQDWEAALQIGVNDELEAVLQKQIQGLRVRPRIAQTQFAEAP